MWSRKGGEGGIGVYNMPSIWTLLLFEISNSILKLYLMPSGGVVLRWEIVMEIVIGPCEQWNYRHALTWNNGQFQIWNIMWNHWECVMFPSSQINCYWYQTETINIYEHAIMRVCVCVCVCRYVYISLWMVTRTEIRYVIIYQLARRCFLLVYFSY